MSSRRDDCESYRAAAVSWERGGAVPYFGWKEIYPEMKGPSILVDLETDQRLEVIPDYVKNQYRAKMDNHLMEMRDKTRAAGMGYHLLTTDKPLDLALTEYLSLRQSHGGM